VPPGFQGGGRINKHHRAIRIGSFDGPLKVIGFMTDFDVEHDAVARTRALIFRRS